MKVHKGLCIVTDSLSTNGLSDLLIESQTSDGFFIASCY